VDVTAAESSRELGIVRLPIQRWKHLLMNGGETAVAAEQDGLAPMTTPACNPESNAISEALSHTLRRNHSAGADFSSAAVTLAQLPQWIADCNHFAPQSALGMRNPGVSAAAEDCVALGQRVSHEPGSTAVSSAALCSCL
jgi:hypothetical protein